MQFWYSVRLAIKEADIIVYVVDARVASLSRHSDIEKMARKPGKAFLFAVNKSDLISRDQQEVISQFLQPYETFFVSGKLNLGMTRLKERLFAIARSLGKDENNRPKVCVVGYPNAGKSSVINALARRARTVVSARAGTTRGIQWVKVSWLQLLDSPGVIPVEEHDETRFALLSARDPEKLKYPEQSAMTIVRYLRDNHYIKLFCDFYKVPVVSDDGELLESIAFQKKLVLKGNQPDIRRASFLVIRDWQHGNYPLKTQ